MLSNSFLMLSNIQRTKYQYYSKLAMLWKNITDKAEEKIQIPHCGKKNKLFHNNS